jgi:hypothetical protein
VSKKSKKKAGTLQDAGGKPESIARKVYAGVAAVLAGIAARKVVEKLWVKTTGKIPPAEPQSPDVSWQEALGWSVVSGTTVGVARLLATRKASGTWQRVSEEGPERVPAGQQT